MMTLVMDRGVCMSSLVITDEFHFMVATLKIPKLTLASYKISNHHHPVLSFQHVQYVYHHPNTSFSMSVPSPP